MASDPERCVSAPPRWFTPLRLLGIFCLTNLFVYLDRGKERHRVSRPCGQLEPG